MVLVNRAAPTEGKSGKMHPETLEMTTLDPKSRASLRVRVMPGEELSTDAMIANLMGKDVGARFKLITENAHAVGELDV